MTTKYYSHSGVTFATTLSEGTYREHRWDGTTWTPLDTMPILRWRDEFDFNLIDLDAPPADVPAVN